MTTAFSEAAVTAEIPPPAGQPDARNTEDAPFETILKEPIEPMLLIGEKVDLMDNLNMLAGLGALTPEHDTHATNLIYTIGQRHYKDMHTGDDDPAADEAAEHARVSMTNTLEGWFVKAEQVDGEVDAKAVTGNNAAGAGEATLTWLPEAVELPADVAGQDAASPSSILERDDELPRLTNEVSSRTRGARILALAGVAIAALGVTYQALKGNGSEHDTRATPDLPAGLAQRGGISAAPEDPENRMESNTDIGSASVPDQERFDITQPPIPFPELTFDPQLSVETEPGKTTYRSLAEAAEQNPNDGFEAADILDGEDGEPGVITTALEFANEADIPAELLQTPDGTYWYVNIPGVTDPDIVNLTMQPFLEDAANEQAATGN